MSKRRFGPPSNPVLRHVLKIQLRGPLSELLSGLLREVGRTGCGGRSVDRRSQGQIAPRIVHEAAADRHGVQIVIEPRAVVTHCTDEALLVLSARAGYAAAVFAADIDRNAECHFGYAGAALAVRVVVFHHDAGVFVNARHPGPVYGSSRSHQRPGGGIGVAAVLRLAERVDRSHDAITSFLAVQIVLSDGIAVEHQFERIVRYPQYLSSEARLAVELGVRLPAVDEPGFYF